jgi:predicted ATPase
LRLKKMLSKLRVQHYKSLFDTEIDLEPLTVFIGPNGSGKSNICESLAILSNFLQRLVANGSVVKASKDLLIQSLQQAIQQTNSVESKFWHGKLDYLCFGAASKINVDGNQATQDISINLNYLEDTVSLTAGGKRCVEPSKFTGALWDFLVVKYNYPNSLIGLSLEKVSIYDFIPAFLSGNNNNATSELNVVGKSGQGIVDALVDILHTNREKFDELEKRLTILVPNIKRISLRRIQNQTFSLELIDRYSEHHIPASDISDGTLRILGFLTALYQENTPSIICFEEIENGIHPWLLHKMVELLKIVSTEGITGNPVQVLITTHSPVLLNYVEPYQVRAVELDGEGKTQVHNLPVDSVRFQKALEAYDGDLGELWFTNVFGGNPE